MRLNYAVRLKSIGKDDEGEGEGMLVARFACEGDAAAYLRDCTLPGPHPKRARRYTLHKGRKEIRRLLMGGERIA